MEFILLIGLIWVVICLLEQHYYEIPAPLANIGVMLVVWLVVMFIFVVEKGYANGMG